MRCSSPPLSPSSWVRCVFCGWGVLVALFAVFTASWFKARFGTARSLYDAFVLLAADLAVIGIWPAIRPWTSSR